MTGAVVDTNVFVHALVGVEPHRDEALRLLGENQPIWAPDLLRAELTIAIWQWVRTRSVPLDVATEVLTHADRLVDRYASTDELWLRALGLACERNHPAHDTLFVALAEREGIPVVTYDRRLIAAFGEVAVTPADLLGGA